MEPISRIYLCLWCDRQVYICSSCDRGNIYCGNVCSAISRKSNTRKASNRYQKSHKGKLKHAKRQSIYRAKQASFKNKVTHHGSLVAANNDLLQQVENKTEEDEFRQSKIVLRCHFCHKEVSDFFRNDFLISRKSIKTKIIISYFKPP